MRGSTLLFHSLEALDPVSFDRVEDIIEEALEPELTYRDITESHPDHKNRVVENSQIAPKKNSVQDSRDKPRRSTQSDRSAEPSTEQLLDLFQSDLSSSVGSPLTKSNYFKRQQQSQFKENQSYHYSCENRRGSSSSISSSGSSTGSFDSLNTTSTTTSSSLSSSSSPAVVIGRKNIMSFHNHHDGRKTLTSFGGSGMPLSKLRSERSGGGNHSHSFGQGNDQSGRNSSSRSDHNIESGFSKFFSGLKSNSNKSDKNRFDVNNLPPQLKNELKRIYVY